MSYIDDSLSTGEEIFGRFKLHWFAWVPFWTLVILSPVTFGITLLVALYEWFRLKNIEQGVTNKRVILKRGIISRKTEEMKITSIETVEIDQGILGRIFGFGTVRVTGRGLSDVIFVHIDDPMAVKKQIESAPTLASN